MNDYKDILYIKGHIEEEIEYVHKHRLDEKLVRNFSVIQYFINRETTTYTNLSLFMNDYLTLHNKGEFNDVEFAGAINDLYLLALIISSQTKGEEQ